MRRIPRLLALTLAMALLAAAVVGSPPGTRPAEANAIPPRSDVSSAVERLYRAYFGRVPERAGVQFWVAQAGAGLSLANISQAFADAPEFRSTYGALSDGAFVDLVYRNVLGRRADADGRQFWLNALRTGQRTRGEVMVGFSESPEFMASVGHLDPGEVERLYRAFFGRSPDPGGRDHWLSLRARGLALDVIAEQFARSDEFEDTYGALDDRAFVELVYRNVLGRPADAAGADFWVEQIRRGASRGQVMVGFSESAEFGAPTVHPDHDLGTCPLFPANSFWHRKVTDLPVHALSDQYVNTVGRTDFVLPDFGAGLWQGNIIGFPWMSVDASTVPPVPVDFHFDRESDPGPYPVRHDTPIQANTDHHVMVVDRETCTLYEMWRTVWQADGTIDAGSGAVFDLRSNDLRPLDWTSADAAGLAMLPGIVRYEEVAAGRIDHAIRITVDDVGPGYIWPARHGSRLDRTHPNGPPYGTRFRLKADTDMGQFTGQALIIATAMRDYGVIVADIGGSWHISGSPDHRWNNQELRQLRQLTGNDLEAVNASSLMINPDSGEARQ